MEKLQITSLTRTVKASENKKLRKQGLIPAVLYGHNVPNMSLSINSNEFEKLLRKAGESTIINLLTDDGKTHSVLIHAVQNHYLHSYPQHVDFYEVSMTEKLKATVAIEFTGESFAVKNLGGILVKALSEIEVECLPGDLPHNIAVDISSLKTFDNVITVKDLSFTNKVTVLTPAEELVAKIQPPRDVEAELATPIVEDISAVEGAAENKPDVTSDEKTSGKKA